MLVYTHPNFGLTVPRGAAHLRSRSNTTGYVTTIHMLSKQIKKNAVAKTQRHDTDTGSPEAQVSLLSRKIEELASHLRTHKKDFHSRRGLLQMVADRRKHLKYLQRKDMKAYEALIEKMGLKR